MATAFLYNLARMTTSTTGTGTITLGSAVTGFLSFSAAGVTDGQSITYAIKDGNNSEIGRGTYTASGTTLTRSVLRSTNSNNALNLSGSAEVFITYAAEDVDVNDFTAETAPAIADLVWLYDASASAKRKMTLENMLKVINSLTADTAPVAGDVIVTYDASATAARKVDLLATLMTWTRPQIAGTSALTHNTSWNGNQIQHATVTVNGSSFTIANPSATTSGIVYMIYISYTTSHSVSWGANFKGVSTISPTATAGAVDIFTFRSNGTNLELVGYTLNAGA